MYVLPLPFRLHLDRVSGDDPRCQGGDQEISEIESGNYLTIPIRRGIDAGAPGRQQAPEYPNLFSFGIGIFFALNRLVVAYRCFGGHAGGGKEGQEGQKGQFREGGFQFLHLLFGFIARSWLAPASDMLSLFYGENAARLRSSPDYVEGYLIIPCIPSSATRRASALVSFRLMALSQPPLLHPEKIKAANQIGI